MGNRQATQRLLLNSDANDYGSGDSTSPPNQERTPQILFAKMLTYKCGCFNCVIVCISLLLMTMATTYLVCGLLTIENQNRDSSNYDVVNSETAKASHLGAFYTAIIGVAATIFAALTYHQQKTTENDKAEAQKEADRVKKYADTYQKVEDSLSLLNTDLMQALGNPGTLINAVISAQNVIQTAAKNSNEVLLSLPYFYFGRDFYMTASNSRFADENVVNSVKTAIVSHEKILLLLEKCNRSVSSLLNRTESGSLYTMRSSGVKNAALDSVNKSLDDLQESMNELSEAVRMSNIMTLTSTENQAKGNF